MRCGSCSPGCSIASRGAKLALGHLGETLPYQLWRFDSRAKLYGVKLNRRPSDYIRDNLVVTTSGMFSFEPIDCATQGARPRERDVFGRLSVRKSG